MNSPHPYVTSLEGRFNTQFNPKGVTFMSFFIKLNFKNIVAQHWTNITISNDYNDRRKILIPFPVSVQLEFKSPII